jgi:hypothetical protein
LNLASEYDPIFLISERKGLTDIDPWREELAFFSRMTSAHVYLVAGPA